MTFKNILYRCLFLTILLFVRSVAAQAQAVDQLIEGAKLCTHPLQHYEAEYGIPSHLLSAIASTESGRFHDGLKIKLPWPWTINAEGKGYFFDSKEEAIEAARKLLARGVESMDLGCMQVNIHHHPDAFSSLSQAFNPENNVAYAANFLRNLYQDEGSWKQAAADYHSKTPYLGKQYVGLVYDSWFKIVDKLRTARLNIPSSSVNGLNEMQQASAALPAASPIKYNSPKYIKVSEEQKRRDYIYKTPSMKSIKVTSDGAVVQSSSNESNEYKKRENGVIIVRPQITVVSSNNTSNNTPEPMVIADASPTSIKQSILDLPPSAGGGAIVSHSPVASAEPEAKIIRLDNKLVSDRHPVNTVTNKKTGPNFIFND
jgi:hypothetical protein